MTKKLDLPIFDPWFGTEPNFTHSADPDSPHPHWHVLALDTRDRVGGLLAYVCATTPHVGARDVKTA